MDINTDLQLSFRALGDPTRRAILMHLRQQEMTITEVVDHFELTRTAVRKHLTILEEGDLISVSQRGKERITQLNPDGLKSTFEWFDEFSNFWDSRLNALKDAVEKSPNSRNQRKKS